MEWKKIKEVVIPKFIFYLKTPYISSLSWIECTSVTKVNVNIKRIYSIEFCSNVIMWMMMFSSWLLCWIKYNQTFDEVNNFYSPWFYLNNDIKLFCYETKLLLYWFTTFLKMFYAIWKKTKYSDDLIRIHKITSFNIFNEKIFENIHTY